MSKFKIGDYVRVKEGVMNYKITKPGSTGHIVALIMEEGRVKIKFDKVTGVSSVNSNIWDIYIREIELYKKEIKVYGIVNFTKEYYK